MKLRLKSMTTDVTVISIADSNNKDCSWFKFGYLTWQAGVSDQACKQRSGGRDMCQAPVCLSVYLSVCLSVCLPVSVRRLSQLARLVIELCTKRHKSHCRRHRQRRHWRRVRHLNQPWW